MRQFCDSLILQFLIFVTLVYTGVTQSLHRWTTVRIAAIQESQEDMHVQILSGRRWVSTQAYLSEVGSCTRLRLNQLQLWRKETRQIPKPHF